MKKFLSLSLALALAAPLFGQTRIQGAGATFPEPVYQKLFADYNKKKGVQVTYQGLGSGAGIKNIGDGIVDFGASDAPLTDKEIAGFKAQKTEMLHIPAVLAAVNFAYNVPGLKQSISLNADIIARIYSGEIKKWNDRAIAALNAGVSLPNVDIKPAYRSDSSGTTYTVSEALSKASKVWDLNFGTGKSLTWTTGIGQKGNAGVAAYVKQTPGAIGYMDYVYVAQNGLTAAKIQNKNGAYVIGDVKAASAAAAGAALPADLRMSITFAPGADASPMATFSYILVRTEQNYNGRTEAQARALVDLLQWMYTDEAQAQHATLYFAPLPKNVIDAGKAMIKKMTYKGQPLVK